MAMLLLRCAAWHGVWSVGSLQSWRQTRKKEETLTYIALHKHFTTDPGETVPDAQARWAIPKWPRLLGIELVLDSHQDSFPSLLPLHPASDAPRLGTQSSRSSCQTMEGPKSSLSTGIQITGKG